MTDHLVTEGERRGIQFPHIYLSFVFQQADQVNLETEGQFPSLPAGQCPIKEHAQVQVALSPDSPCCPGAEEVDQDHLVCPGGEIFTYPALPPVGKRLSFLGIHYAIYPIRRSRRMTQRARRPSRKARIFFPSSTVRGL